MCMAWQNLENVLLRLVADDEIWESKSYGSSILLCNMRHTESWAFGKRLLTEIFTGLGIGLIITDHVVFLTQSSGVSMLPTCNAEGDLLLVSRLHTNYKRGDIVISTSPIDPTRNLVKRIFAVPGDRMRVNGTEISIPPGHVFLLGDNHRFSQDSRYYGPVPIGLLQGTVMLRIWPLSEFGALAPPSPPGASDPAQ